MEIQINGGLTSESASKKAQNNAKIFFGPKGVSILSKLEELKKEKMLHTDQIDGLITVLSKSDAETVTKLVQSKPGRKAKVQFTQVTSAKTIAALLAAVKLAKLPSSFKKVLVEQATTSAKPSKAPTAKPEAKSEFVRLPRAWSSVGNALIALGGGSPKELATKIYNALAADDANALNLLLKKNDVSDLLEDLNLPAASEALAYNLIRRRRVGGKISDSLKLEKAARAKIFSTYKAMMRTKAVQDLGASDSEARDTVFDLFREFSPFNKRSGESILKQIKKSDFGLFSEPEDETPAEFAANRAKALAKLREGWALILNQAFQNSLTRDEVVAPTGFTYD